MPYLSKFLPLDVNKDFAPIGIGVFMPMMLGAASGVFATKLAELIAHNKTNPGKPAYGTPGSGTAHHNSFETLRERRYDKLAIVAVFMDSLIVGKQHILAVLGLDATGHKHLLSLVVSSSENARVAKDLLEQLRDQGLDLGEPRLWVMDGSKALVSAISCLCGQAAKAQRCQIHKIRNVTERLPKDMRAQVAWRMKAAFGLQPVNGMGRLKALAQELKAQHPDAAPSVLEGLEQMFTAATLGVQGPLARSLSSTNIIESPNSVVRRRSQRVKNYPNADMALRWTVIGFLKSERGMRRTKGFAQLPELIRALRPQQEQKLEA